jgi:hypothetical protein
MLIRPLREFVDDMGRVSPRDILDVTDYKGADLIRRGLAVNVQGEAAEKGTRSPISSPPIASPIGAGKQQSSSPAGPAPQTPISTPLEAGPASSASTKAGGSRRGRMRSTPATERGGEPATESLSFKG